MTAWTDFVKDFAKKKSITYGCALSDPDCSKEYKSKYGDKKPLGMKKEKGLMGAEDRPAPEKKTAIADIYTKGQVIQGDNPIARIEPPSGGAKKTPAKKKEKPTEENPWLKDLYTPETTKSEIEGGIGNYKKMIDRIDNIQENVSKSFFSARYKKEIENRKTYKKAIVILEKRLRELNKAAPAVEGKGIPNPLVPPPHLVKPIKKPRVPRLKSPVKPTEAEGKGLNVGYKVEGHNGLAHIYPISHESVLQMLSCCPK